MRVAFSFTLHYFHLIVVNRENCANAYQTLICTLENSLH